MELAGLGPGVRPREERGRSRFLGGSANFTATYAGRLDKLAKHAPVAVAGKRLLLFGAGG